MTRLLLQHQILGPGTTQAKSSSSAIPCIVLGFLSSFAQVKLPLSRAPTCKAKFEQKIQMVVVHSIEDTPLMLMRYYGQEQ